MGSKGGAAMEAKQEGLAGVTTKQEATPKDVTHWRCSATQEGLLTGLQTFFGKQLTNAGDRECFLVNEQASYQIPP